MLRYGMVLMTIFLFRYSTFQRKCCYFVMVIIISVTEIDITHQRMVLEDATITTHDTFRSMRFNDDKKISLWHV